MSVVWHLHRPREEFYPNRNTVRGTITGTGRPGNPVLTQVTVENLARRIRAGVTYRCLVDTWYRTEGTHDDVPTFEIQWPYDEDGDGIPDRDRLLFHWANAVRNRKGKLILLGCVATGEEYVEDMWETAYPGEVDLLPPSARNLPGVSSSRDSFRKFMVHNAGLREFMLKVTEDAPPELLEREAAA